MAYRTTLRLLGLLALCLTARVAVGDPSPGFGLYLGPVASNSSTVYGTAHGVALNADAQFVYNSDWTLSPYLSVTSETSSSSFHVTEFSGGLQPRYWMGHWFVGGQYLFHSTFLSYNGVTKSGTVGPSLGLVAGWEADNHWSVVLQADFLEGNGLSWVNGDRNRNDLMLLIGYHWY